MKTPEQIVREACQTVWNDFEIDRVGEFYADDYTADYPMGDAWGCGVDGVKAYATLMRSAFPDYTEEVEDLIAQGDKVVVCLRVRGTHRGELFGIPPTNKTVDARDITICEVRDGKIIKQTGLSDTFTMYTQLGLIPSAETEAA
ncbi:MAG: ester cyclase [Pseudomonadota bacterium]